MLCEPLAQSVTHKEKIGGKSYVGAIAAVLHRHVAHQHQWALGFIISPSGCLHVPKQPQPRSFHAMIEHSALLAGASAMYIGGNLVKQKITFMSMANGCQRQGDSSGMSYAIPGGALQTDFCIPVHEEPYPESHFGGTT